MTSTQDSEHASVAAPRPARRAARPAGSDNRGRTAIRQGVSRLRSGGGATTRETRKWAALVAFVGVCVLVAAWLWMHRTEETEVLTIQREVPAGSVLELSDLGRARVSGVPSSVSIDEVDSMVGRTATVGLLPGQVLTSDAVTDQPVPARGSRLVSLQADGTRVPAGLQVGDQVQILAAPPAGDTGSEADLDGSKVLASQATVVAASTSSGNGTRLTVQVDAASAPTLALYASSTRVVVVQAPMGGDS